MKNFGGIGCAGQKPQVFRSNLTRLTTPWHRDTVPFDERCRLNFLCPLDAPFEFLMPYARLRRSASRCDKGRTRVPSFLHEGSTQRSAPVIHSVSASMRFTSNSAKA